MVSSSVASESEIKTGNTAGELRWREKAENSRLLVKMTLHFDSSTECDGSLKRAEEPRREINGLDHQCDMNPAGVYKCI